MGRVAAAIPSTRAQRVVVTALAAALAISILAVGHQAKRPAPDFATRYAAGIAVAHSSDPYASSVTAPIERALLGRKLDYPFRDPPPTAWAFRAMSTIPYDVATRLWLAVILIAAFACTWLTFGIVGVEVEGVLGWAILVAIALDFAPLRDGISRLQIDPFVASLTLAATVAAAKPGSGVAQALATMKPQTSLLASAGGLARGRFRFVVELIVGWLLLVGATAIAAQAGTGPSWRRWVHALHGANRSHSGGAVAITLIVVLVACSLSVRLLRSPRGWSRPVWLLAIAACINGAVAPLVFSNSQSDVLLLVPLLLAGLTPWRTALQKTLYGGALGVFAVSGLFAVTYHSGVTHAAVPLAVAALLATVGVAMFPKRISTFAIALGVNITVTALPLTPRTYDWLGCAASLALLYLLAGVQGPILDGSRRDTRASAQGTC